MEIPPQKKQYPLTLTSKFKVLYQARLNHCVALNPMTPNVPWV